MLYDIYFAHIYSQGDIERQEFYYFSPLCFKKPVCFLMRKNIRMWIWAGRKVGRIWESWRSEKHNPNIMYENKFFNKNNFGS